MKKITLLTAVLVAACTYAQDCEPGIVSLDFESVTAPALPACVTLVNNGSSGTWATANNPGNGFTSNTLQYNGNNDETVAWLFMPGVDMVAGTFYHIYYRYGNNSNAATETLTLTMGTAPDLASAQTFTTHTLSGTEPAIQNIELYPAPSTGTFYFGFHAGPASQSNIYLDDIVIEKAVCGTPSGISIDNITADSATASWGPPTGGTISIFNVYQYAYATTSTPPAEGSFYPGTSVELSGLSEQTTYYFFTRALCGPVWSDWTISPFTTEAVTGSDGFSIAGFKAYPNPVKDIININATDKITSIKIYNITGQLVLNKETDTENAEVNLNALAAGPYILHAFSESGSKQLKLIKE